MKKKIIEMQLILGLILFVFVSVAGYKFFNRESQNTKLISTPEINLKRIKELTESSLNSAGYQDKKSIQETRKEICQLTARSVVERNKGITAIRNFLDNPRSK